LLDQIIRIQELVKKVVPQDLYHHDEEMLSPIPEGSAEGSRGYSPTEGTFTNYENLDNKIQGIHDYFKWLKFGYGRATDSGSTQIRLKQISREDGMRLVKQHEGKLPEKFLDEFLDQWEMSREKFLDICDKFTNKELFKKDENGILLRDKLGNLEKINYDNLE